MGKLDVRVVSVLLGCVGAGMVWAVTSRYGIGLSPDSTEYVFASQSLIHGRGLLVIGRGEYVAWPPLYPVLLGIISLVSGHVMDVARAVSALSFGGLIFMSALWLQQHCRSRLIAFLGVAVMILLVPLWEVTVYAWSEGPFLALATAALLVTGAACARPTLRLVAVAAALAMLAWLTRYIGITVAASGVLALLLWPSLPWRVRLRSGLLFGAIAAIPNGVWLIRNQYVSGTLMGARIQSTLTLHDALEPVPGILASWILPDSFPGGVAIVWIGGTIIVATMVGILAGHVHNPDLLEILPAALPLLLFVPIYFAWLVQTQLSIALTPIDVRYLSPLGPPLVLVFTLALDRLILFVGHRGVLLAACSLTLIYPAWHLKQRTDLYLSDGAGQYHSAEVVESPTLKILARARTRGPLYASDPLAVYDITAKVADYLPDHFRQWAPTDFRSVQHFRQELRHHGPALAIWTGCCTEALPAARLRRWFHIRVLARTRDGGIYRISA